ncbi:MAG: CAP domain-containing protein [Pseudomonadota bacterium]
MMLKIIVSIVACLMFACASSDTSGEKPRVKVKTVSATKFELRFIAEVNKVRAMPRTCGNKKFSAAAALALNAKLTLASYKHSLDMFENQFLEHVSSNGDTLVERLRDVNYDWSAVAENLAHNQKSIQQVIEDWLSSPGHCSNVMSSDYTQAGVAVVNGYWTQVYAAPK